MHMKITRTSRTMFAKICLLDACLHGQCADSRIATFYACWQMGRVQRTRLLQLGRGRFRHGEVYRYGSVNLFF